MPLKQLSPGASPPDDLNVIVEIPLNGEPVKYEVDKASGAIFVDRVLKTAMRYPCNYGYVPRTLCGDGDPLDVLVVAPVPFIPGSVVRVRPVGMLAMRDEAGDDAKVIAVPVADVTGMYRDIQSFRDLPEALTLQVEHFFAHYKDLERGKWVEVDGWKDADAARREVMASIEAYSNGAGD